MLYLKHEYSDKMSPGLWLPKPPRKIRKRKGENE